MRLGIKIVAITVITLFTCNSAINIESPQTVIFGRAIALANRRLIAQEVKPSRSVSRRRRVKKQRVQAHQSDRYSNAFLVGLGAVSSCAQTDDPGSCATLESSRSVLWDGCNQGNKNACSSLVKLQELENAARLTRTIRSF